MRGSSRARRFCHAPLLALLAACGGGGDAPAAMPRPTALAISAASLPPALRGRSYEATLVAFGGSGIGRSWRLSSGALPPGLVLDGLPACLDVEPFASVGTVPVDEGTGERTELSGLAASRRNPGVLWAHDDSGAAPLLHALDADGALLRRYVLDVEPGDWEDVALGPGPDDEPGTDDTEVLYVADIGDNAAARAHVTILCVVEPAVAPGDGAPVPLDHEAFAFVYPDGPRDAEALLVDWTTGALFVVEKGDGGADAYRVPVPLDPAWTPDAPGVLERVTTGRPLPGGITAADAARDARRVLLRGYFQGYELVARGAGLESAFGPDACRFDVPALGQFEALAIAPSGSALFTTTERVLGAVGLFRAPVTRDDRPARIAGTPLQAGVFAFEVEVVEASGTRATRAFEIVVAAP